MNNNKITFKYEIIKYVNFDVGQKLEDQWQVM